MQGVCYSLKRIGGKWRPGNKVTKISCSFALRNRRKWVKCLTTVLDSEISAGLWWRQVCLHGFLLPRRLSHLLFWCWVCIEFTPFVYFPKVKLAKEFCSFGCVSNVQIKTLLYRGSLEFEDTMDLLNCTVCWKLLFENVCTNIQYEIYLMFIIVILERYSLPGACLWSNRGHGAKKGQQHNVPKSWSCSCKVGIQIWLTTYRVLFSNAPFSVQYQN